MLLLARSCKEICVDLNTMTDPHGAGAEGHQLNVLLIAEFYLGELKEEAAANPHL